MIIFKPILNFDLTGIHLNQNDWAISSFVVFEAAVMKPFQV